MKKLQKSKNKKQKAIKGEENICPSWQSQQPGLKNFKYKL